MVFLFKRGVINDSLMYRGEGPSGLSVWVEQHYGESHIFDPFVNNDQAPNIDHFEYAFDLDPHQTNLPGLGLRFETPPSPTNSPPPFAKA